MADSIYDYEGINIKNDGELFVIAVCNHKRYNSHWDFHKYFFVI